MQIIFLSILLLVLSCDWTTQPDDMWGPTNISIHRISYNEIKITWDQDFEAINGIIIDKKIENYNWSENYTILDANATEWIDGSIELWDTYYYYKVYAFSAEDTSTSAQIKFIKSSENIELVPLEHNTIQGAVDVAEEGDTILVYPGTYFENLHFSNKSITICSLFELNNDPQYITNTIIDGQNNGTTIVFNATSSSYGGEPKISGFTVTGGNNNGDGGGIYCMGVSAIFSNLIIQDNHARHGGGIAFVNLPDNFINTRATLINSLIINNHTSYLGGGILVNSYHDAIIINCTIANNTSSDDYGGAGGVLSSGDVTATITNCILWNNSPNQILAYSPQSGFATVTYSNVQEGWEGSTNINSDPLFVDSANNNFHIQASSPCINSGNPGSQYKDQDGTRNNMGAYGGPRGNW